MCYCTPNIRTPFCQSCATKLYTDLIASQAREAELLEKLEAEIEAHGATITREAQLSLKLEAAESKIMKFSDQCAEVSQWYVEQKQRAEAAEARIKASQEQKSLGRLTYSERGGFQWHPEDWRDYDYMAVEHKKVFAQPPIPPELAELQRQVEFWKNSSQEWKLAYVALGGTASESGKEELRKLLKESKVQEVTDDMVDRMIDFLSRGSTMHHPDVPYLGTENGDTETEWKRRVMKATMEYALTQPKEPKQ